MKSINYIYYLMCLKDYFFNNIFFCIYRRYTINSRGVNNCVAFIFTLVYLQSSSRIIWDMSVNPSQFMKNNRFSTIGIAY